MTLQQVLNTWNLFFHTETSSATLVLFRILSGIVLLINALLLVPLINDYFSEDGVWPTSVWSRHAKGTRLCVLNLLPPKTGAFRFLLLVHLLSIICYLVGFHYRIATVTLFVTMASIHHRNSYILSSGDTLMRILLFLMCFSDAGGGLSVDRWLADQPVLSFGQTDPWPMRLMQIQICIIYLRTVFWKLRGNLWWSGKAAWYPLWVEAYVRFRPPTWMLNKYTIAIATWGTLIEEMGLCTLIWIKEFRYPMLVLGVLFHLMLEIVMNLQLFSWIMIVSLMLFVYPQDAESFLSHVFGR